MTGLYIQPPRVRGVRVRCDAFWCPVCVCVCIEHMEKHPAARSPHALVGARTPTRYAAASRDSESQPIPRRAVVSLVLSLVLVGGSFALPVRPSFVPRRAVLVVCSPCARDVVHRASGVCVSRDAYIVLGCSVLIARVFSVSVSLVFPCGVVCVVLC